MTGKGYRGPLKAATHPPHAAERLFRPPPRRWFPPGGERSRLFLADEVMRDSVSGLPQGRQYYCPLDNPPDTTGTALAWNARLRTGSNKAHCPSPSPPPTHPKKKKKNSRRTLSHI